VSSSPAAVEPDRKKGRALQTTSRILLFAWLQVTSETMSKYNDAQHGKTTTESHFDRGLMSPHQKHHDRQPEAG